jgi:hypothetical protein
MLSYATESTPAKTPETLKDELRAVNQELASMKNLAGRTAAATWRQRCSQGRCEPSQPTDARYQRTSGAKGTQARQGKNFSFHGMNASLIYSNSRELDEAKQTIADLEEDLKAERSRLRVLTVEQTHAEREKENVLLQMRRTESDMEDVKLQLQRIKRNNNELEGELRGT